MDKNRHRFVRNALGRRCRRSWGVTAAVLLIAAMTGAAYLIEAAFLTHPL